MRAERQLLRIGEYLVRGACQQLPPGIREERYREWAAELPAILHDPQIRPAPRRAVRMLGYAADTLRGTIITPGSARGRIPRMCAGLPVVCLVAGLGAVSLAAWTIVQAPGDGQNYLRLAWGLLFMAYLLRRRVRPAGPMTGLLRISALLALAAAYLWNAVQVPGDWVNDFVAALFLLPLLVGIPLAWWLGRLQARTGGRHASPSDPWTFTF